MEYQCVYLNPVYHTAHDSDAVILFESDNLAECCTFVYNDFKQNKKDIAVWQERSQAYREIYQNKKRDKSGKFAKFEDSIN